MAIDYMSLMNNYKLFQKHSANYVMRKSETDEQFYHVDLDLSWVIVFSMEKARAVQEYKIAKI